MAGPGASDTRGPERLAVAGGDPCAHTAHEFLADGLPVQFSDPWEPMAVTDGTPVVLPEMGPLAGMGASIAWGRSAGAGRSWR